MSKKSKASSNAYVTLFRSKLFKAALMTGLFITSVLIIMAMMLGNEAGNFVVKVESGDASKSIAITDDENDRVYTNKLVATGYNGMTNSTPRWLFDGDTADEQHIGIKKFSSTMGSYAAEDLYKYTFLIVNTSTTAITVKLTMNYSNVTNYFDQAVRVMTYDDDSEALNIYQLPDTDMYEYAYYPTTPKSFGEGGNIYSEEVTIGATADQEHPEYVKYSVFFWLEGQDPDCTEKIFNGTIKFALSLSVV